MNIITTIKKGNAHPYRIQIDGLHGVAVSPASAVMAALSVGKKIPVGMRDRKKAVAYILDNYPIDREWIRLIRILEDNKFNKIWGIKGGEKDKIGS